MQWWRAKRTTQNVSGASCMSNVNKGGLCNSRRGKRDKEIRRSIRKVEKYTNCQTVRKGKTTLKTKTKKKNTLVSYVISPLNQEIKSWTFASQMRKKKMEVTGCGSNDAVR